MVLRFESVRSLTLQSKTVAVHTPLFDRTAAVGEIEQQTLLIVAGTILLAVPIPWPRIKHNVQSNYRRERWNQKRKDV